MDSSNLFPPNTNRILVPTRLIFRQLIENRSNHGRGSFWFFFHTMEKVVKKIVCTLPNANFARERVTRRDLIALARTNCNQRRDCDNICPAPYSNTYLHTYADQRIKMFLSKRFFNGFVWSFEKDVKKIFDLWNKLITIFIEKSFLDEKRKILKNLLFFFIKFQTSLYKI